MKITKIHGWLMCLLFQVAYAKNILFLLGMPSKSGHIWNKSLIKELVKEGHNVTALSVEVDKSSKNLHYIPLDGVNEKVQEMYDNVDYESMSDYMQLINILAMYEFFNLVCKTALQSKGVEVLLKYPRDAFDLVVHDYTCGQCLLGFVNYFNNPPLISVSYFNLN